jgi:hypothetical protein
LLDVISCYLLALKLDMYSVDASAWYAYMQRHQEQQAKLAADAARAAAAGGVARDHTMSAAFNAATGRFQAMSRHDCLVVAASLTVSFTVKRTLPPAVFLPTERADRLLNTSTWMHGRNKSGVKRTWA